MYWLVTAAIVLTAYITLTAIVLDLRKANAALKKELADLVNKVK